ncbi:Retrovirus-related Pol poly from transposon TNT 1-94 [Labeo rohita]|uniref:Retrovirus-related Pol poly from transposon TNT 1-94 n=1 Tax=Labeo rohita TaxID=84645 RepID=A0A498M694_LABRO|nr:Retrovirus-related Pol poly from transposon TNT 1-94 [Labeo rohita]
MKGLMVDSGATKHTVTDIGMFEEFDSSFKPQSHILELADGERASGIAMKKGTAKVRLRDSKGCIVDMMLMEALYVPSFSQDIFSVKAAIAHGATVIFKEGQNRLIHKNDRLFYLSTVTNEIDECNVCYDLQTWHEILGHCNYDDVLKLESVTDGMKIRDLAGPIEPAGKDGFRFVLAFTDDYSGAVFTYFLKKDVYEHFEHSKRAETQVPKLDVTKVIPQEIKVECDAETDLKSESESGQSARYPKRERRPPQYYTDYDYEIKGVEDQALTNIDYYYRVACDVPQTLKETLSSSKSEQWVKAMKEEMDSLIENNTFTLTTLPEGKNAVGGRWVYTIKENPDEIIYKARYVAKGYSQVPGIDYNETFSPTADMTSVRVLMQLAAQYDLELHQMDVKTAYLHAPIDCEMYMEQPEGFEVKLKTGEKLVCKLNKSLYGLKLSG